MILSTLTQPTTLILLWLGITLFCLILEIVTTNLVSIWFSLGALVSMILALFVDCLLIQIAVFIIVSALTMILTKPIVEKHFRQNNTLTNFDLIIGTTGVVTESILKDERGVVKVDGKYWTAICRENEVILKDERVIILAIDGVKLIVSKEKGE